MRHIFLDKALTPAPLHESAMRFESAVKTFLLSLPGAQLWKEQRVCAIDPLQADSRLQC